ncbi:GntR family transcriptional regulator [Salinicoccus sediminis]|uniref:GntR family transcriptional regulator n=1 Tax=Salinicoccus sediminis TaxID=1432562 RepID=A0A0M2SJY4_9STAP|nr:GntR family transcriptional regulator [Salinicoccus sediminis]KKK34994.1 GntR family transcriptional regulator [Salinicoccus sediminis]
MLNRTKYQNSTRDFVYETLRDAIVSLELPPGATISEKEISEELEVSRTPVREAFLRLTEDELLTVLPQRGSYISLIDLNHVEDARFLREQAEAGIIRLACESFSHSYIEKLEKNLKYQKFARDNDDENELFILDKEFHRLIAEGAGKTRVWEVIQKMDTHSNRLRKLSLAMKLNWKKLVDQHKEMVAAIKAKNPDQAEQLMREHLALLIYDQKALKESYPDYFN